MSCFDISGAKTMPPTILRYAPYAGTRSRCMSARILRNGQQASRQNKIIISPSAVEAGEVVDQELEAIVQRLLSVNHRRADLGHVRLLCDTAKHPHRKKRSPTGKQGKM